MIIKYLLHICIRMLEYIHIYLFICPMMRTTINLPLPLYQRLTLVAKQKQQSLSGVIRELLGKAVIDSEKVQREHAYHTLLEVKGIAKGNMPDASNRIDEILYGPQGVWKGQDE